MILIILTGEAHECSRQGTKVTQHHTFKVNYHILPELLGIPVDLAMRNKILTGSFASSFAAFYRSQESLYFG